MHTINHHSDSLLEAAPEDEMTPGREFEIRLNAQLSRLRVLDLLKVNGRVSQVIGLVIESIGPNCSLGEVCIVKARNGDDVCMSEVVGFRNNRVLSMVLGDANSVSPGSEIVSTGRSLSTHVGFGMLGRVIDGLGQPIDGKGA
jgi:flagellum-specific ATP synthase